MPKELHPSMKVYRVETNRYFFKCCWICLIDNLPLVLHYKRNKIKISVMIDKMTYTRAL